MSKDLRQVLIEGTTDYCIKEDGVIIGKLGFPLKSFENINGYSVVSIKRDNKFTQVRVHREVAKAFIPNPENKPEVNHINGIKTDNRVENLEWVTSSENQIHATRVLRKGIGETHPAAKLSEKDVHYVCELFSQGVRDIDVEKITGISRDTIVKIRMKAIWKDITKQYKFPKKSRNLSTETVEWVCRKFEEGYTSIQIQDLAKNPKLTLSVIKGIKGRYNYKWISKNFNF